MTHPDPAAADVFATLEICAAQAAGYLAEELRKADPEALRRLDLAVTAGAELAIRCDLGTGAAVLLVRIGGSERELVRRTPPAAPVPN